MKEEEQLRRNKRSNTDLPTHNETTRENNIRGSGTHLTTFGLTTELISRQANTPFSPTSNVNRKKSYINSFTTDSFAYLNLGCELSSK